MALWRELGLHALPLSYDPGPPKAKLFTAQTTKGHPSVWDCRVKDCFGRQSCSLWLLMPLQVLASLAGDEQLRTGHKTPASSGSWASRSFYVQYPGSRLLTLLLPDSWAFSRTGLSAAETPPRGPETWLLRQSKRAQETGRKCLVPKFSQVLASVLASRTWLRLAKSPRLRGAGLCDCRPGALCPQWWKQWS